MNIEEKKKQLNDLMIEYSQLKDDPSNKARCKAIRNQAAIIIFSPVFLNYFCKRVREKLNRRYTYHGADEFVTDSFFNCVDKYDHRKNDNFYSFFISFLVRYQVTNGTRGERINIEFDPTITDGEGNEIPFINTIADGNADPGTRAILKASAEDDQTYCCAVKPAVSSIQDMFDHSSEESISEDEAKARLRFIEYASKIIPCVNQANEHRGRHNEYYRAFATDFYIAVSKEGLHLRYSLNENEAFNTMDLAFADWTMTNMCRSFSDFASTPCKNYAAIGVTDQDYSANEIETPFKNVVFKTYFSVTDSAVSQQRRSFHNDIGLLVSADR